MIRPSVLALLAFALLSPVGSASAASKNEGDATNVVYDPSLYQALEYRLIGPYRGGRVTAVTGVPKRPFTFYMGATGSGVWETHDAGETWENISDGFRLSKGQYLRRRWSLQIHRRRENLDARGSSRGTTFRASSYPPEQSRLGLRGGARSHLRTEPGAWRLPVEGRGQELGESALHLRENRRRRSLDESGEPAADLRCNVARRNPGH